MRQYITEKRASAIIRRFSSTRVLIIGDLIMDHFIWGKVRRISPEAPVPVVEVASEDLMLGGSANVANNVASLGGVANVTGVVGTDNDGKKFVQKLKELKLSTTGVMKVGSRPTTIKTRIIAHGQQVVRFDREDSKRISPVACAKVMAHIKRSLGNTDVVVLSDYAKGLITEGMFAQTIALCKERGIPVAVDPKVEHFNYYHGATVVTPNNLEASTASGIDITDSKSLTRAGWELTKTLGCSALLITRGEHGMSLFEGSGKEQKLKETHIPTVAKEVFDVSGAGDTVIGVMALALGARATYTEAAALANFAAGVVVGKIGTATLSTKELKEAINEGLKA
ncbi:MAG: D-glycero-beta-D-manno-heptose-7-phosphate kinase [Proteobacteria bacterium]|nr:D-glycero-beta-D-manno-heptose-7-phosphate kinase [Pseudomonadota bacterium]